jgi:hypothetical protein
MTGLFRLSRVSDACSPLWCTAEDALRLNATVPFTPWGWMSSAMVYFRIASRLAPVRGSVHLLPRWCGWRRCA